MNTFPEGFRSHKAVPEEYTGKPKVAVRHFRKNTKGATVFPLDYKGYFDVFSLSNTKETAKQHCTSPRIPKGGSGKF